MPRFSPDSCITCGTRFRTRFSSHFDDDLLADDGTFFGTCFWFCSNEHFLQAVESFMDKRFHRNRSAYQDPNLPDDYIEEFIEQWQLDKQLAIKRAQADLITRAVGEYSAHTDKLQEEEDKKVLRLTKEIEAKQELLAKKKQQIITDQQKQLEKARKEQLQQQEREQREARQALFDSIRLEDRDRNIQLQQQRETDRQEDRKRRLVESEETRQWRLENREWQLQERERREKDRAEQDALDNLDQTYEQAQLDHELHAREDLFNPKPIPQSFRFEHVHIPAPTGAGKTTLYTHLLFKDFRDYDREAAHIIIDPKGSLIDRLSSLSIFDGAWADRLVLVDPFDRPAFNIFSLKTQNVDQIVSNFGYIFASVGQKLTPLQTNCFSYCASLLFKTPGANLTTMLDLLDDRTKGQGTDQRFVDAIASLTEPDEFPIRRFFERDYYNSYGATREGVKTRVQAIFKEPNLAAIFNAQTCKLDVADWIEKKKIVVVNTRLKHMPETHQILGRLIISCFQQAVLDRNTTHPAFLFIDEFQEFADEYKTPQLLRLIREYNAGAVIAHQNMICAELDGNTRNAISTNTLIKFASNPGGEDIGTAARDLRCSSEFLTKTCVKTTDNSFMRFGCYFTGLDHPFVYEVTHEINNQKTMTPDRYRQFRADNKAALSDIPKPHKAPEKEALAENQRMTAERSAEANLQIPAPPRQPAPSAQPRAVAPSKKPTITLE